MLVILEVCPETHTDAMVSSFCQVNHPRSYVTGGDRGDEDRLQPQTKKQASKISARDHERSHLIQR